MVPLLQNQADVLTNEIAKNNSQIQALQSSIAGQTPNKSSDLTDNLYGIPANSNNGQDPNSALNAIQDLNQRNAYLQGQLDKVNSDVAALNSGGTLSSDAQQLAQQVQTGQDARSAAIDAAPGALAQAAADNFDAAKLVTTDPSLQNLALAAPRAFAAGVDYLGAGMASMVNTACQGIGLCSQSPAEAVAAYADPTAEKVKTGEAIVGLAVNVAPLAVEAVNAFRVADAGVSIAADSGSFARTVADSAGDWTTDTLAAAPVPPVDVAPLPPVADAVPAASADAAPAAPPIEGLSAAQSSDQIDPAIKAELEQANTAGSAPPATEPPASGEPPAAESAATPPPQYPSVSDALKTAMTNVEVKAGDLWNAAMGEPSTLYPSITDAVNKAMDNVQVQLDGFKAAVTDEYNNLTAGSQSVEPSSGAPAGSPPATAGEPPVITPPASPPAESTVPEAPASGANAEPQAPPVAAAPPTQTAADALKTAYENLQNDVANAVQTTADQLKTFESVLTDKFGSFQRLDTGSFDLQTTNDNFGAEAKGASETPPPGDLSNVSAGTNPWQQSDEPSYWMSKVVVAGSVVAGAVTFAAVDWSAAPAPVTSPVQPGDIVTEVVLQSEPQPTPTPTPPAPTPAPTPATTIAGSVEELPSAPVTPVKIDALPPPDPLPTPTLAPTPALTAVASAIPPEADMTKGSAPTQPPTPASPPAAPAPAAPTPAPSPAAPPTPAPAPSPAAPAPAAPEGPQTASPAQASAPPPPSPLPSAKLVPSSTPTPAQTRAPTPAPTPAAAPSPAPTSKPKPTPIPTPSPAPTPAPTRIASTGSPTAPPTTPVQASAPPPPKPLPTPILASGSTPTPIPTSVPSPAASATPAPAPTAAGPAPAPAAPPPALKPAASAPPPQTPKPAATPATPPSPAKTPTKTSAPPAAPAPPDKPAVPTPPTPAPTPAAGQSAPPTSNETGKPFQRASGQALADAAGVACTAIGCDASFAQKLLAGVCSTESGCNAQVSHIGFPYQGLFQAGPDATQAAMTALRQLARSSKLSPAQKAQITSAINASKAELNAGQDPNKDSVLGAWIGVGYQMAAGSLSTIGTVTNDPALAAAYGMLAQIAPDTFVGNFSPNKRISTISVLHLQGNNYWVPYGATAGDAARVILATVGQKITTGINWSGQFSPSGPPAPSGVASAVPASTPPATSAPSSSGPYTKDNVTIVGDSIGQGTSGCSSAVGTACAGTTFKGNAVSGAPIEGMIDQIKAQPNGSKIAIIAGTNNYWETPAQIGQAVQALIAAAQAKNIQIVAWAGASADPKDKTLDAKFAVADGAVKGALPSSIPFVDLRSSSLDPYRQDGYHYNAAGYKAIGDMIIDAANFPASEPGMAVASNSSPPAPAPTSPPATAAPAAPPALQVPPPAAATPTAIAEAAGSTADLSEANQDAVVAQTKLAQTKQTIANDQAQIKTINAQAAAVQQKIAQIGTIKANAAQATGNLSTAEKGLTTMKSLWWYPNDQQKAVLGAGVAAAARLAANVQQMGDSALAGKIHTYVALLASMSNPANQSLANAHNAEAQGDALIADAYVLLATTDQRAAAIGNLSSLQSSYTQLTANIADLNKTIATLQQTQAQQAADVTSTQQRLGQLTGNASTLQRTWQPPTTTQ